jgi:trimeric autotransporter adhesin
MNCKTALTSALALALALFVGTPAGNAQALTSTFTYQGELKASGSPANASFDMEFRLFNAQSGGSQIGSLVSQNAVAVTNGLFNVPLSFGASQFAGERQWLEIRMKPAGSGSFETLSPRTEITAAPYAWAAANALANSVTTTSIVDGAIGSADIDTSMQRRVASSCPSGQSIRVVNADGSVTCESSSSGPVGPQGPAGPAGATGATGATGPAGPAGPTGLTGATGATGAAGAQGPIGNTGATGPAGPAGSADAWGRLGNSGTNSATNFIGTIDAQAFEVRTHNSRSLRIEPSAFLFNGVPITSNHIGGSSVNSVSAGVRGAVIAGGGAPEGSDPNFAAEGPNTVTNNYGVVGGGLRNSAADLAHIGGGLDNTASGRGSSVSGGNQNAATGQLSSISGGGSNTASGTTSFVSGGTGNCAGGNLSWVGGRSAKTRVGNEVNDGTCAPSSGDADGDNGTFVWADDQPSDFISTGPRQFLIRSEGGVAINTNTPQANTALTVNGSVALATTGSLSFGSQVRQMLNLWGPNEYGIGVQASRLYSRAGGGGGFNWFVGGVHNDAPDNPGAGGFWRMHLGANGQLLTTTGTIGTLSDARLKDQVTNYIGALDRINALRTVTYHYKDAGKAAFQPEGTHIGFIAQEMQKVFPQWVSQGDDGYLMLSMRGFEGVAVRALQELSAENEKLRAELSSFETRLRALEARLD